MRLPRDSASVVLALLLAAPALAATPARKPVAAAKKPAAQKVEVIEPQPDAAALMAGAREAQGRGETELALRLAQSAIVAAPAKPETYNVLGDIYAATGQSDFAQHYYNVALGIDPTDTVAQKAIAALERGKDKRAAEASSGTP